MKKAYKFTKSKKLWVRAQKVIAGGSQGTRLPEWSEFPTYFEKAKGCRMWDVDGNEFIDLLCSIGPILLGYAYKPVDDAVRAIIKDSFQSSSNHPVQVEVAEKLVDMIPCAKRVRFLKTGTEATQAVVRISRYITGRIPIARHGYHGWADMWQGEQLKGWGIDHGASDSVLSFDGTAEGLEKLFKKSKKKFGTVILCPADTRPFTKENYQGVIDAAHEHGALVIFDEIKSGFRMALGGAQEVLGVTPDLTTISKGMANGYPLSAVVGKAKYMDQMDKTPTAGTFSVEALSLAACLATLKELEEKNVVDHLYKMGQRLIDGLNEICQRHGFEETKAYPDPVPSMPRFKWKPYTEDFSHPEHDYFFGQCHRYGLFFCKWHVTFVNYSHKAKDIDEVLDICDFVMGKTKKKFRK